MKNKIILTFTLLSFGLFYNSAFAIPYCSSTEQVNCAKYGIGGKDCQQTDSGPHTQCIDVSDRGMDAIRRHQGGRNNQGGNGWQGGGDWDRNEDRCPSGFSPSEDKCSAEERRRGCKDMRTASGLGCVNR